MVDQPNDGQVGDKYGRKRAFQASEVAHCVKKNEHKSSKHGHTNSREQRLSRIQDFGAREANKPIHLTDNIPVPVHPRITFFRLP